MKESKDRDMLSLIEIPKDEEEENSLNSTQRFSPSKMEMTLQNELYDESLPSQNSTSSSNNSEDFSDNLSGSEESLDESKPKKSKIQKFLKKYYTPLTLIFWFILLYIAQKAWNRSAVGCTRDLIFCIKWMKAKAVGLMVEVVTYATIHYGIFLHAIMIKDRKKLKYTGMALTSFSLVHQVLVSNGFSVIDHSKANAQVVLLFLCSFCIDTFRGILGFIVVVTICRRLWCMMLPILTKRGTVNGFSLRYAGITLLVVSLDLYGGAEMTATNLWIILTLIIKLWKILARK